MAGYRWALNSGIRRDASERHNPARDASMVHTVRRAIVFLSVSREVSRMSVGVKYRRSITVTLMVGRNINSALFYFARLFFFPLFRFHSLLFPTFFFFLSIFTCNTPSLLIRFLLLSFFLSVSS